MPYDSRKRGEWTDGRWVELPDYVEALKQRLNLPAHTCVDQPDLPCPACNRAESIPKIAVLPSRTPLLISLREKDTQQ